MKNDYIKVIPAYKGIGVYSLINNVNGKMYIGATQNVYNRIMQHNTSFKNLKCSSAFLEDIKNGNTFSADVLEELPYGTNQFELFSRESYYISHYNTIKNGYNTAKTTCSSKEELLESLEHFSNNTEMYAYIKNIIRKREQPILPTTTHSQKSLCKKSESITIMVPKGQKAIIKSHAEHQGESMNSFVVRAINETMERETE